MRFFLAAIAVILMSSVSLGDPLKSTINDQTAVEMTVYNSNVGLVKDTRTIDFHKGQGELKFMDVAASIMPETVHIKSLDKPGSLSVLEQNYEYDLINEIKLLDKYVGKKVKLLKENFYTGQKEVVEATLLSNNNGQVYQIGNEIYLGFPGQKILPEIPENLIAQPTLTWEYEATGGRQPVEVSYLTNGINWKADYVLNLNENDTEAGLSGWVTLINQSGATYKNAKLKLVAGDINRVQAASPMALDFVRKAARMEAAASNFAERSFFEYHIYDLQHPTTIKENETKQVLLLQAEKIKTHKEFIVNGNPNYFFQLYRVQDYKVPVEVYISFKNSKDNNLGMPLPGGIMRLYKSDVDKSLQFIGEDSVEHTPKDEEVRLKIGKAFDLVAERKQTDFRMISNNVYETSWEITLRNHKKEDTNITVMENMATFGEWEVISSSQSFEKKDVSTIAFDVPVPKDGEVKVTYQLRVRYGY
jgi:hypothetical protein